MASHASPKASKPRPSTTQALFDDVIVPAAGEFGAVVDRVVEYSRKSPGQTIGASLLVGAALGWLATRPRRPPETWVQNKTRQLAEAARAYGYPLSARQLQALARTRPRDWLPR